MADGGLMSGSSALGMLGALGGATSSGNTTQTVNRDPWRPAQPYIQANINSASQLQDYYQKNPLSALQKTAYNNAFVGNDSARQGLSALTTQLGNNQGWSRNSGPRLPQGYNFQPLGVTNNQGGFSGGSKGGSVGGGLMDGALPSNPFSSGGIGSYKPKDYSAELQALISRFPASLEKAVVTSTSAPSDPVWSINPMWALSNGGTRNPNFPDDRTANPNLPAFSPQKYGGGVYDVA